jgi:hypothetical protein
MASCYPTEIDTLKQNQDKINHEQFSTNLNLFTYDYDDIKQTKHDINKAVIEYTYYPDNIQLQY